MRALLAAMVALQAGWLSAIWMTGAARNLSKVPVLLVCTVVSGAIVAGMPGFSRRRLRHLEERLLGNEPLLVSALCVVVLLASAVYLPFQRILPDEQAAFAASKVVAEQGLGSFFASYSSLAWLGRQHPPLVPIIAGFAMRLTDAHFLVLRVVSILFLAATVVTTYFLGRQLYDRAVGLTAALLLLAIPYTFRVGLAARTDMPVTFFFSLALLLALGLLRQPAWWLTATTGLVVGVGLLSKYTMVFIFPVLLAQFFANGDIRRGSRQLAGITLGAAAIVMPWVIYAYHSGILMRQQETLAFYASIVRTVDGPRIFLEWILTNLPSGLGVYNLAILGLGVRHMLTRADREELFLFLWIAVVAVLLLVTLPDPRYFMPTFPALAIVMASGLRRSPGCVVRVMVLALIYCTEALYLYADGSRASYFFIHRHR